MAIWIHGSAMREITSSRKGRWALASGVVLALALFVGLAGPSIVPYDPVGLRLELRLQPPGVRLPDGEIAWFGTDQLGRDLLRQVIHGARVSILVALVTVIVAGVSGTALGLLAGYAGGLPDMVIMRLVDLQLAFPPLLLAILISAVIGQ